MSIAEERAEVEVKAAFLDGLIVGLVAQFGESEETGHLRDMVAQYRNALAQGTISGFQRIVANIEAGAPLKTQDRAGR